MLYALFFVLGLAAGSFLNVVSLRYKPERMLLAPEAVGGRSRCPHCGKALKWHELVPVLSYVWLRGRCGSCETRLTLQYPLVELLSGFIFVFTAYYFLGGRKFFVPSAAIQQNYAYLYAAVFIWILVFLSLLLLSLIDYREYLVPDEIVYFLFFLGLLWLGLSYFWGNFSYVSGSFLGPYADIFGLRSNLWFNHLVGVLAGFLGIAVIFFISRGKAIGFGDVKLLSSLGLLFGWPDVFLIMTLAFIIGAAVSLGLIFRGKKTMKDFVPFAPFIALASFIVFYFGQEILRGYFLIFNF